MERRMVSEGYGKAWRVIVVFTMLGFGGALTGCNLIKAMALMTAPDTEKVAPEFNRMPEKRVVVYVWTPPEVTWDYPKIRFDLAANISAYLQQNVQDVDVVEPLHIESHLEKTRSAGLDAAEVGRHFNADLIVHASLLEFSIRDPGMSQFYRGRLSASVQVIDLTDEDGSEEVIPLKEVSVVVPESGPVGFHNATPEQVRAATYEAFAIAVGQKFHEYERPL
jgi:hypothetical protein